MAHKGDFPECNRCTSFQCSNCGLDNGVFKEEGDVSKGNTYINYNILIIVGFIIAVIADEIEFNAVSCFILIVLPVIAIYQFLIHRTLKEDNSNNKEAEKYYIRGLIIDIIVFICLAIRFINLCILR